MARSRPLAAAFVACACLAGCGGGGTKHSDRSAALDDAGRQAGIHPRAVEPEVGVPDVVEVPPTDTHYAASTAGLPRDPEERLAAAPAGASRISPGAPTDDQVRAELRALQGSGHGRAYVLANGQAVAPSGAPAVVKQMIAAGNVIARLPYLWGGGHARLYDTGYDCSGSLSFAFIQAGLLQEPIAQGWSTMGAAGPGRWVSVYSNAGHVWMTVAGLRFDTSAIHIAGSRWTTEPRSLAGFIVRHLPGL